MNKNYDKTRSNVSAEMTGFALRITTVVDGKDNMYMVSYDGQIRVSINDTDVPRELARTVEGHKYATFKDAFEDVAAVTAQVEAYRERRSALVHDITADSASVRFHFNESKVE